MLFAFVCIDKPDHIQVRLDTRPTHVDYLTKLNEAGTLKLAGPFLNDDGKPVGSLVVVDVEDRAAAKSIADNDPYTKAGLFEKVDIHPWTWTFNKPA
jgi:uncharacterized protein YciI